MHYTSSATGKAVPVHLPTLKMVLSNMNENVRLVFENEPFDDYDTFVKEVCAIQNELNTKVRKVGVCVDTAHLWGSGVKPEDL